MRLFVPILFRYNGWKHHIQSVGVQVQITKIQESSIMPSRIRSIMLHSLATSIPLEFGPTPKALIVI